jgi:hypothetical protein
MITFEAPLHTSLRNTANIASPEFQLNNANGEFT